MSNIPASSHRDEPDASGNSDDFPYWRRNLAIVPPVALLNSLGFAMAWPFLPLMVRELGITQNLETWVGNMMLMFYIIGFVMNPIWGGLADHYGRKLMVLRATLGMGCCMLLVPFATTPLMFAALLMLVGVFNGASSAFSSLLVATTPQQRLGTALTLAQSGNLIGRTMGPGISALAATFISQYHLIFRLSGSVLILGGLLAILVRDVKRVSSGHWRPQWVANLRVLLAVPRMGTLLFLCFISSSLWAGNITIISIFTLQLFEASPPAVGNEAFWVSAMPIGLSLASLVALPFWGRMLDRVNPARVVIYAFVAAILTHLPLLFLQTPLQLLIGRIAFGLTSIAMEPALVRLLKSYAPEGMEARAIAFGTSFQFFAMGLAPFFAGLIGPVFGLRAYIALLILLASTGLLIWMRSRG